MDEPNRDQRTRRELLLDCALGAGPLALLALGARTSRAGIARRPSRARRIVFLHMAGAPSQLDLFDPKPALAELDGQAIPESFTRGERFAFIKGTPLLLKSPYAFRRAGAAGHDFSELLPNFARIADRLTVVRSMHTTQFNHAPAQILFSSGHERIGRPSFGSWISYGLGSANENLPTFVVLTSGAYGPDGGSSLWSSGFLPGQHQGVRLRAQGEPVLFLENPQGVDRAARRRALDALKLLNERAGERTGDPEIAARIEQYEMAFRMQASVPELADLSSESAATLQRYGAVPGEKSFANNCLLARRLLERGVRFVQLYHWGWDSHGTGTSDDLLTSLPARVRECEPASAALIEDLAERGLLEDTLVVWGGEFGRTPMNERRNGSTFLGRDHHPHAFTLLLAGGGIAPGVRWGETDELGYRVVRDPVSVHDLHATLLHLLGFDHLRFTYRHQGRDFRLTDVAGEVVQGLLA